jgi:hypothetical protein
MCNTFDKPGARMMKSRMFLLVSALAVGALALAGAACGGGGESTQSPTQSLPLVAADPAAVVHRYEEQGFSIAFGPQWQDAHESVTVYDATAGSTSTSGTSPQQGWRLSLKSSSGIGSGGATLTVLVMTQSKPVDPKQFQATARTTLAGFGAEFEPVALNGVPALHESGQIGSASRGETIMLASGGRSYVLRAQGPAVSWEADEPQLMAIMQTFTLLPQATQAP